MNPENYIQIGDEVSVMFRSLTLTGLTGQVLDIESGEYGRRVFVIQPSGSEFGKDAAVGVLESAAVFSVRRGDCMVGVPLPMLIEEATEKEARRVVNERKRIEKKAPLFADQIEVREGSPENWVRNSYESGAERLEHDHLAAMQVNALRAQVQALCSADDFSHLCERRKSYPQSPLYGGTFWKKQLEHIQQNGAIDRLVISQTAAQRLNIPWLKSGSLATWLTGPDGESPVRVIFVGSSSVMCQLPDDLRKQNFWLRPNELAACHTTE